MEKSLETTRRTFLKGTAILGGLAAFFSLKKTASTEPAQAPPQEEEQSRGYQLTEHVRRYYEIARL